MDYWIRDILILLVIAVASIKWWFTATDIQCKKYIIYLGIFFLISFISDTIGNIFDISFLLAFAGVAALGFVYFLIKAILAERKAKKKQQYN